uniref:Uncharacterized protein n=1 Tax=Acrobeloides nanus TaxID=290746 RepID=A0A914CRD0_9BILA
MFIFMSSRILQKLDKFMILEMLINVAVKHAKELYFIWMQDWEWPDDVDNGIVTPQDYAVADLMGATWTY